IVGTLVFGDKLRFRHPVGPVSPWIEQVHRLDPRIDTCGKRCNRSSRSLPEHADAIHVQIIACGEIVNDHLHVVNGGDQGESKLADNPFPHGLVMVAMAVECRDEANRGETILSYQPAELIITEAVCLRWIPIYVENDGRLRNVLWLNDVKVNKIAF